MKSTKDKRKITILDIGEICVLILCMIILFGMLGAVIYYDISDKREVVEWHEKAYSSSTYNASMDGWLDDKYSIISLTENHEYSYREDGIGFGAFGFYYGRTSGDGNTESRYYVMKDLENGMKIQEYLPADRTYIIEDNNVKPHVEVYNGIGYGKYNRTDSTVYEEFEDEKTRVYFNNKYILYVPEGSLVKDSYNFAN